MAPVTPAAGLPLTPGHAQTRPGTVIKDCADCPEVVVLPTGSFMMGTPRGSQEIDLNRGEGPQVSITVDYVFAMGRTEVTHGQFKAFVDATGHQVADGEQSVNTARWERNWRWLVFALVILLDRYAECGEEPVAVEVDDRSTGVEHFLGDRVHDPDQVGVTPQQLLGVIAAMDSHRAHDKPAPAAHQIAGPVSRSTDYDRFRTPAGCGRPVRSAAFIGRLSPQPRFLPLCLPCRQDNS